MSAASDRLVRDHAETIYHFLADIYPLERAHECVAILFSQAESVLGGSTDDEALWHLLHGVRAIVQGRHSDPVWQRTNARAARALLSGGSHGRDVPGLGITMHAMRRVMHSLERDDEALLHLIVFFDGLDARALSVLMDIGAEDAANRIARVSATFTARFGDLEQHRPTPCRRWILDAGNGRRETSTRQAQLSPRSCRVRGASTHVQRDPGDGGSDQDGIRRA